MNLECYINNILYIVYGKYKTVSTWNIEKKISEKNKKKIKIIYILGCYGFIK